MKTRAGVRCWYSRQKAVRVHSFGRGRGVGLLVLSGYVMHKSKNYILYILICLFVRTLSFLNVYYWKEEHKVFYQMEKMVEYL